VLAALLDKTGSVDWNINDRTDHFTVISKSGFTKKAEEFAGQNNFTLYTLEDLEIIFNHP